jgi:4-diphosphocytidyl-2-C-methyl-D-erythritol kinase
LRLANETLPSPLPAVELEALASSLGADVPFFLRQGPQLGSGDGSTLEPLVLPQDFWVLIVLPHDAVKDSTAAVYARFDEGQRAEGFEGRRSALLAALRGIRHATDLATLPRNDLASSRYAAELERQGAFRADVSGAGPAVYGLFVHRRQVSAAARALRGVGRVWITAPAWYG